MPGVFGEFSNGPIQFNHNSGSMESRGTIDAPPSAAAGPQTPATAPASGGGGVLAYGGPTSGFGGPGMGMMPASSPASDNGGSYGMGGLGRPDNGGSNETAIGLDDGGEVPDESDGAIGAQQGAESATFDPMQAISMVLAYGRKQSGLPANFSQGPGAAQAFDDGGEVEQEDGGVIPQGAPSNVTAGGNSQMPDPRKILSYLTGGGNVSPDVAGALERHVDPGGSMEPSRRTVASILAAPNPEAAFGMMQHYRTRFNAYSGGARAALDQGDLGQAAVHGTQAMENLPTGYHVQFAPARGGVAMTAKKLGRNAQPAVQSAEDGGPISSEEFDARHPNMVDLPESENVEDRRGEPPDPSLGPDDPRDAYQGALDAQIERGAATEREKRNKLFDKLGTIRGFADGGEVEEDDTGEGVIQPEAPLDEPQDQPQEQVAPVDEEAGGAPTVLTPEQFKQMMADGYDKPLDEGFGPWLKSILNAVNPVGTANAAEGSGFRPGSPLDRVFAQPAAPAAANPAAPADNPGTTSGWLPSPSIMKALQEERNQTVVPKTKGDREQVAPQPQPQPQQAQPGPDELRNERLRQYQERVEKLATKLYPWAGQEDQRSHYVAVTMQKAMESEFRQDQETSRNRGAMEGQRQQGRMSLEQLRQQGRAANTDTLEAGRDTRNLRTNDTRREGYQTRENAVDQRARQAAFERALRQERMNNVDPETAVKNVARQFGVNPEDVQRTLSQQPQARGGQQQAPQQQQPAPQSQGGTQQPRYVVYPSGPFANQLVEVLPDGRVRPVAPRQ